MPEVHEVFRMATQKVRPDPGALERQVKEQRHRTAQRRAEALGLAIAIAIVAALVAVEVSRDTGRSPTTPATRGKTTPDAIVDVVGRPSGIADAGGSIWVATYEGTLNRIDPTTNRILDTIDIGEPTICSDLVVARGSLWVSGCAFWGPPEFGTVQIDPATGDVVGTWSPFDSPVFGDGRAWGFDGGAPHRDGVEVDPATGRVIRVLPEAPLGYAFGSLWFVGDAAIVRADPDTGAEIASYPLASDMTAFAIHGKIGGFASAGGYVWVTTYRGDVYGPNVTDGALYRIDPRSGDVEQMLSITLDPGMSWNGDYGGDRDESSASSGPGPEAYLDATGGVVWVAQTPSIVVGIDVNTGGIVATYPAAGDGATNVEVTADAVWVTNFGDGTVWRYDLPASG